MRKPDIVVYAVLVVMVVLAVLFMAFSESELDFGASVAAAVFIAARAVQTLLQRWHRQRHAV